jgi:response regulator RpfG family c-di-GMP phosphodiesterase
VPTILITARGELRASIVPTLEMEGYLVLEASSETEALRLVICQTRSIEIFLADVDMNGRQLAHLLTPYRPEMEAFFIASDVNKFSDALNADTALEKVRERLKVPNCIRREALANLSAGRAFHLIE